MIEFNILSRALRDKLPALDSAVLPSDRCQKRRGWFDIKLNSAWTLDDCQLYVVSVSVYSLASSPHKI